MAGGEGGSVVVDATAGVEVAVGVAAVAEGVVAGVVAEEGVWG